MFSTEFDKFIRDALELEAERTRLSDEDSEKIFQNILARINVNQSEPEGRSL